jgi:site-specific DNA-methyltransferase (adenine-specific)
MADLPYQITAAHWDIMIPFGPLWENYSRLNKASGAIVLFSKQPFTTLLAASNMKQFRYEWIWKKSNGGEFLNANRKPLPRHENISVFYENSPTYNPQMSNGDPYACTSAGVGVTTSDLSVIGWRTINTGDRYPTSILEFPNETGLHPTQKPVALLAAQNEGRRAAGIETSEEYIKIAIERLRQPSFFSIPEKVTVKARQLTIEI